MGFSPSLKYQFILIFKMVSLSSYIKTIILSFSEYIIHKKNNKDTKYKINSATVPRAYTILLDLKYG